MNLPTKNSVRPKILGAMPPLEADRQSADKKTLTRKCFACGKKEDPDGRCKCTNQDAW